MLTNETYMEMQTEQQFQRMMNRVNGSGNFYDTMQDLENANPEYAKTAISKLMSTPFAYDTLEKMLQG
jgi:hypothetical protein